jgi:outer membrane murein-binding lipoprotein Lpp
LKPFKSFVLVAVVVVSPVVASCASSSDLEALRAQVQDLQVQVSTLQSDFANLQSDVEALRDAASLADVQQALNAHRITVPAESIEKPFLCGARIAVWQLFADGLTCQGAFGE